MNEQREKLRDHIRELESQLVKEQNEHFVLFSNMRAEVERLKAKAALADEIVDELEKWRGNRWNSWRVLDAMLQNLRYEANEKAASGG